MASLFVLLQHASLLAALGVLSPIRYGSDLSDSVYRNRGMIVAASLRSSLQGDRLCPIFNYMAKGPRGGIFGAFDITVEN